LVWLLINDRLGRYAHPATAGHAIVSAGSAASAYAASQALSARLTASGRSMVER
jgi:hypothetical protein